MYYNYKLYDLTIQLLTWLMIPNQMPYTQRRVLADQCYITVQLTGSNFECSLNCNSTVIVCIVILHDGKYDCKIAMH